VLHRVVTLTLAAATALASVPTLVRVLGDHERKPLVLLVVTLPYAFVVLLVLLAVQGVLRRTKLAGVTAFVLALNLLWFVPLYVAADVPNGQSLNAMTANLQFGEADAAAVVRLVKAHRVDVLATQELTPQEVAALHAAGLDAELPFHELLAELGPDGSGLWSRYPLSAEPAWDLRFRAPGAVVHAPGRDVVVRVVHAYPPVGSGPGSFRGDLQEIVRQTRALQGTLPAVVLGDFNATLDTSFLRALMGGRFRDAGELAGSGLQRTWGRTAGSRNLLDLDHVFVDRHRAGVRSTEVLDVPGTDHDAVLARIVLA
jgi:endonuclease/exonuclease/phosphatase (EEP) superfamily protein YafD